MDAPVERGIGPRRGDVVAATLARWSELSGDRCDRVTVRALEEGKSAVYLLAGVGRDGTDVVAKVGDSDRLRPELVVYRDVAPALDVPFVLLLGYAELDGTTWLFLEDGGDRSVGVAHDDCVRLAEWLAALHLATAGLGPANLPDHGLDRYRRHLAAVRDAVDLAHDNPVVNARARAVLGDVDAVVAAVERDWDEIVDAHADAPSVLVHGDLVPKNVRLVQRDAATVVVALDWEMAGTGPASPDLGRRSFDLPTYAERAVALYPGWDGARFRRFAAVGAALRSLAAMDWVATHLSSAWIAKPLANLPVLSAKVRRSLIVAGVPLAGVGR